MAGPAFTKAALQIPSADVPRGGHAEQQSSQHRDTGGHDEHAMVDADLVEPHDRQIQYAQCAYRDDRDAHAQYAAGCGQHQAFREELA